MAKSVKLVLEYDAKSDVLFGSLGKPRPSLGEDLKNGVTVFRNEESGEVVGFDIYGFAERLRGKKLEIPLSPELVSAITSR